MADSQLLRVRRRAVTDGVAIVSISGEIDLATAAEFGKALAPHLSDPDASLVVCDMSQVQFLACSGLSVLVDARSALAARGARLRVVANHPAVVRPVTVTGLLDVLQLHPNLSAALTQSIVD